MEIQTRFVHKLFGKSFERFGSKVDGVEEVGEESNMSRGKLGIRDRDGFVFGIIAIQRSRYEL